MDLWDPERTVVVMHYYEGLSPAEIGVRTGTKTGTVRQQMSRAVGRLRAKLGANDERGKWLPTAVAVAGSQRLAKQTVGWFSPAVLAQLALVGAVVAAWVLTTTGDEPSELEPSLIVQLGRPAAATQRALGPLAVPAAVPNARTELSPPVTATPQITVRIIDRETRAPVKGVPWYVTATGSEDYGRIEGFGPEDPNLPPLFSGVTDAKGTLSFPDARAAQRPPRHLQDRLSRPWIVAASRR